jgi:ATP-dependent Clp protease adaptor protein ClpS
MSPELDEITITETETQTEHDAPWNVIVYDDPVNLMSFVTLVLKRVFGYPQEKAEALMLEVHRNGLSVVWSGEREKAELYVQQLQAHQLLAAMKKS